MICNAKLRNKNTYCQKHGMQNGRCRLHGGLSLSGSEHPQYTHGHCTLEARQRSVEANARIRLIVNLARSVGLLPTPR